MRALAEALSPLSHSLAAGLLIRPLPVELPFAKEENPARRLVSDLAAMLDENVPILQRAVAALEDCDLEETEELVDELATAALDLVDMARGIWETPLPPEAESLRPLLATIAEAPVTQVLQWILEIMHYAIDPWAIAEDPEQPEIGFVLEVPDAPLREALVEWRKRHPGVISDAMLNG